MVKESADLSQLFNLFKKTKMKNRKRFNLEALEQFLIKKSGGVNAYERNGGYHGLYQLLKKEEKRGQVVAIKSSSLNGRHPPLKTRWQLVKKVEAGWEDQIIFKLSRKLNLNYYLKRPELQTEKLKTKLRKIYDFLEEKEDREWASREERSLELFNDEKFLSRSRGKRLMNRLKLSLADIKAEKYSQMFVYWNNQTSSIQQILILENHSAFISCKRALETDYGIFSYKPDTLIYGKGKQIIKSLQFLKEIVDIQQVQLKYAGDLDPEGFFIYVKLKEKYPEMNLKLHSNYYKQMLLSEKRYPLRQEQVKKQDVFRQFLKEIKNKEGKNMAKKVKKMWKEDLRIPQEIITYERLIQY